MWKRFIGRERRQCDQGPVLGPPPSPPFPYARYAHPSCSSEAAEWLGKREYKGLEDQKVEVKEATKGRKGVASGYAAI